MSRRVIRQPLLHIGFTGTQHGMTSLQTAGVRSLLPADGCYILHHGDCIGADAEANEIALFMGADVYLHPPDNDSKRAFCLRDGPNLDLPLPYLQRNQRIVDTTTALIAAPSLSEYAARRSGTWATVRMARRARRFIAIVYSDGIVTTENGPRPW